MWAEWDRRMARARCRDERPDPAEAVLERRECEPIAGGDEHVQEDVVDGAARRDKGREMLEAEERLGRLVFRQSF